MAGPAPPNPKTLLGRHRLLAPTASVRVSPICLGGMSIGNNWKAMFGECTKENAFELLDTFYDLGGNFIDTANVYQLGQSEEWVGDWMQKTGRRNEMVIATKYSGGYMAGQPVQQSNFGGTGTKSLHMAVESSLKKLQTDYIDLYFIHSWDYATDIPELMQSLNVLVQQGKVLYLGISDTPAWVVVKANCYAREHGLRPFSVYQGRLSAHVRDMESDIIPMCQDQGMAIQAWGVMANGYFRSPSSEPKTEGRNTPFLINGREVQVSQALENVSKRHNVGINSVALAYVLQKAPHIYPILGGRKIEHLKANVEALSLELSPQDVVEIEDAYPYDPGFPHNFISRTGKAPRGPQDINTVNRLGHFDYVQGPTAIRPHKEELKA